MAATLKPKQLIQLQSFWNLIQATDEDVQKELYFLLGQKYNAVHKSKHAIDFLQMKGVLKGPGTSKTDVQMLDEYLADKYDL